MFSKLKKKFFGDREIESVVEAVDKVSMVYKGGGKESCSMGEYEAGVSDKSIETPADRQKWFVKRTAPLREAVGKTFEQFNPRYEEVQKIILWVQEGFIQGYKQAVAKAFDVRDFEGEVSLKDILPEEDGRYTPVEKAIAHVCRDYNVKVHEIISGALFAGVGKKFTEFIDDAVTKKLGGDPNALRCDDLNRILDAKITDEPKS